MYQPDQGVIILPSGAWQYRFDELTLNPHGHLWTGIATNHQTGTSLTAQGQTYTDVRNALINGRLGYQVGAGQATWLSLVEGIQQGLAKFSPQDLTRKMIGQYEKPEKKGQAAGWVGVYQTPWGRLYNDIVWGPATQDNADWELRRSIAYTVNEDVKRAGE